MTFFLRSSITSHFTAEFLALSSWYIVCYIFFWFKHDLGQTCYAPHVRPDQGLNSWPPDHDSTLHVTETPALTTRPSVTSISQPYFYRAMNSFVLFSAKRFMLLHFVSSSIYIYTWEHAWLCWVDILCYLHSLYCTIVNVQLECSWRMLVPEW